MNEWMNEFIILSYKMLLFINDNYELNFAYTTGYYGTFTDVI